MTSKKTLIISVLLSFGVLALMWVFLKPPSETAPSGELLPAGTTIEGPASSTVTIVEFLDFQCPSCGAFQPVMKKIREEYAGRIRFAERQFPLPEIHPKAKGAAIAAVCADRQGKYFEYADGMMANQSHLEREDLIRYAGAFKLDTAAFEKCLDDSSAADFVVSERKAGEALGVKGTPWIFVNGKSLDITPTYDQLKKIVEEAFAASKN